MIYLSDEIIHVRERYKVVFLVVVLVSIFVNSQ